MHWQFLKIKHRTLFLLGESQAKFTVAVWGEAVQGKYLLCCLLPCLQVHSVTLIYAKNLFSPFPHPDRESRRPKEELRSLGSWAKLYTHHFIHSWNFLACCHWEAQSNIHSLTCMFSCTSQRKKKPKIAPFRLLLCVCFGIKGKRAQRRVQRTVVVS